MIMESLKRDRLSAVTRYASLGMDVAQIAANYSKDYVIAYDLALSRMKEPEYVQAIEAGRQLGLGRIWESLYEIGITKKDQGILLLLAKERLKVFGQVENDDLLAKSMLSKDKLKKIYEIISGK